MKTLSLVIPVYNEEAILEHEAVAIMKEMKILLPQVEYELLLVENGSSDRTHEIAQKLAEFYPEVRAVHLDKAGYGYALKYGLEKSEGKYIVLFNIDFWDVHFVKKSLAILENEPVDIIVGSKTMKGAEDTRPFLRRLITRTFNALLRAAFGFEGTDTHGMKVLRRDKMLPIIAECRTEREIFDTEFVLRAQTAGLKSKEVPVMCEEKRKTTYNISKRIPRTLKDLIVLFFTLKRPVNKKLQWTLLGVCMLFFLVVGLWGFPDSPSPWFDEGVNLGIAKTYVEDGIYSLRTSPGQYVMQKSLMISTNYPVLFPIAGVFAVFGSGLAQAKVVMLLFMIAYLLAAYRLVGKMSHQKTFAAASIALLVTFLPFYGNGLGGGLGEVPGLFFFVCALLFLSSEKPSRIFLSGIFFGLLASTKVFYLVTLAALGVSEIVFALREKKIPLGRWLTLAYGILPFLLFWVMTLLPEDWDAQSWMQVVTYYKNPYNIQNPVLPNILRFFTETTPAHFTLLVLPFFFWVGWRIWKKTYERHDIVIAVFFILNIIWYVRTPGWYRYLFPAHLLALTLFPVAVSALFVQAKNKKIQQYGAACIVGLVIVTQTLHLIPKRGDKLYYNPAPRHFAAYVDEHFSGRDVMIVDQPELWFLVHDKNVRQYVQMNPYVAFGEKFLEQEKMPDIIINNNPEKNPYLAEQKEKFEQNYSYVDEIDRYRVFIRNDLK